MSADPFAGLEPAALWKHFSAYTKIARPSGNEAEAIEYAVNWAKERGYEVSRDKTGNACIHVPGSAGMENAPVVVIQGHVDMVCERDSDSPYDAEEGRIHVVLDGDWIKAEGTTLGADNAIGVCAGMAAAEDDSVAHPPLDLLLTIDEETGMTGAIGLDASMVRGKIMLNLDSEDDNVLFVGCAGGCDTKMALTLPRSAMNAGQKALAVKIAGLQGGHSGLDINRNRLNSIRALARVLGDAAEKLSLRIATIEGGSKRNAIPREAGAVVFVAEGDVAAFEASAAATKKALAEQYAGLEDGLNITVEAAPESPAEAFDAAGSLRALGLLSAIPTGVVAMSQDIDGLVETSTNLGVVSTEGDTVRTISCSRSSVMPALRDVLDSLRAAGRLAGAEVNEHGGYPGWKPDMDSKVLAITKAAYAKLNGEEPGVTAIHAGLECGLLGERVPGMDMISFGPNIRSAHAPGERVSVSSVGRFWGLLKTVLADLGRI